MAIGAIAALFHDLLLTAGIYSIIGFEVSPSTIVGLLTILGFSLYDTVVVFDKVDENVRGILGGSRITYSGAANLAVNQTLMRSINTSLIALLPVAGLLFVGAGLLGVGTIKDLALVLFVGLASGAYSSIFLATPIVCELKEREPKYKALAKRVMARRSSGPGRAAGPPSRPGRPPAPAGRDPPAPDPPWPSPSCSTPSGRRRIESSASRRPRAGSGGDRGAPSRGPRPQRPGPEGPALGQEAPVSPGAGAVASAGDRPRRADRRPGGDVPDFPSPGILFNDLTPLLADGPVFRRRSGARRAVGIRPSGGRGGRPTAVIRSTSSQAWRPAGSCWPPPSPGRVRRPAWCRSARPASCPGETEILGRVPIGVRRGGRRGARGRLRSDPQAGAAWSTTCSPPGARWPRPPTSSGGPAASWSGGVGRGRADRARRPAADRAARRPRALDHLTGGDCRPVPGRSPTRPG